MTDESSSPGCSVVVVLMISALVFVVGIIAGAASFLGFLHTSKDAVYNLELAEKPKDTKAECPPCKQKECPKSGGSTGAYGLVYPIEESLRIEGQLDKDALREHVIKQRFKLKQCYQTQLKKDGSITGEMSLSFTVSSKGNVMVAVARQDTTNSKELQGCILNQIKKWNFKDKIKSSQAVVKIDVLFVPLGSGTP